MLTLCSIHFPNQYLVSVDTPKSFEDSYGHFFATNVSKTFLCVQKWLLRRSLEEAVFYLKNW